MSLRYCFEENHVKATLARSKPSDLAVIDSDGISKATIHDSEGRVESWDERRLIPGMLALIQEQDKKIKELEARLAKIEEMLK